MLKVYEPLPTYIFTSLIIGFQIIVTDWCSTGIATHQTIEYPQTTQKKVAQGYRSWQAVAITHPDLACANVDSVAFFGSGQQYLSRGLSQSNSQPFVPLRLINR